jgi:hypothetical protein
MITQIEPTSVIPTKPPGGWLVLHAGFLLGPEDGTYSSETSINFQRSTRRHISEYRTFDKSISPLYAIIVSSASKLQYFPLEHR